MLLSVILPVFLMVGMGFLVGKYQKLDAKTLSNLAIYLLTPSLVFTKYLQYPVDIQQILKILVFALALFFSLWIIAYLVSRLLKQDRFERQGFALSVVLINSGNMGLPFVIFAFGDAGMSIGVIFLMINIFTTNSLGVFIAAGAKSHPLAALKKMLFWPTLYATAAAILIQQNGWQVPETFMKPLNMIGDAAIPIAIILLGVQLSKTKISTELPQTVAATILRLFLSPVLAYLLTELMGFTGMIQKILIFQTSMPTAVYAAILSTKFDARPEFVSGVILLTTLLSALTLTGLLYLLN